MYYFIGIVTFIGLLLPLVLHFKLKRLIRAAEHPGKSEHPLIKVMLNKFTACYKVQVGVNNVDNFVDKYVYTYKIGGFYLFTWDKLCGQPAWILLYGCFIQVIVDYLYFGGQLTDLSTIGVGVAASGLLMLYNHLFDRMDKLRVFAKEMADYLENSLGAKLEQEYLGMERGRTARSRGAGLPENEEEQEDYSLTGGVLTKAAKKKRRSSHLKQRGRAAKGQETETASGSSKAEEIEDQTRWAEADGAYGQAARKQSARGRHALDETYAAGEQYTAGKPQGSILASLSDQEMEALLGELAASVSGRGNLGKDQEIIDEILKEYLS